MLACFKSADRIFIVYPDSLKNIRYMIQVLFAIKPKDIFLVRSQCDKFDNSQQKSLEQEIQVDQKYLKNLRLTFQFSQHQRRILRRHCTTMMNLLVCLKEINEGDVNSSCYLIKIAYYFLFSILIISVFLINLLICPRYSLPTQSFILPIQRAKKAIKTLPLHQKETCRERKQ